MEKVKMNLKEKLFIAFIILMLAASYSMIGILFVPVLIILSILLLVNIIRYLAVNKNDSALKSKRISILENILLLKMTTLNSLFISIYGCFVCSCGHHYFKYSPFYIFAALEAFMYFYKIKNYIKSNSSKKAKNLILLILWILITIFIYAVFIVVFRNDMDAIHRNVIK